jgi:intein-encoded DNA endonuclease-like protein
MTTEQNLGPEISGREEEMMLVENGQRYSESALVCKEEFHVVSDGRKRREYRSGELRIKLRDRVIELRQQGRSYNEIRAIIKQEFGIVLSKSHISYWTRGIHDPHNGRRIPSLELLEPSEDLAYVISVLCGDGHAKAKKGYHYVIYLEAKDKEFVEEFAIRVGRVLNRPPPKVKVNSDGRYYVEVKSRTLYELLKKPIDLEGLRKYIEHCEKCIGMFLRGFFDSEGSVSKSGYITATNTNHELLTYVQRLLKRFGIESTGPDLKHPKGSIMYCPRTGKPYRRKEDSYTIYILAEGNERFYRYVGFTIQRKRVRLENYLRRMKWRPAGVPHYPRCCEGGVRASLSPLLRGQRAWWPSWPAYRVGGRANRRPSAVAEGKGEMRGCPLVGGSFEPLPPAGGLGSRGPGLMAANTPCGGLAVLRAVDN